MHRIITFLLLLVSLCCVTPRSYADALTEDQKKEDPRLAKRVRVVAARIYLGELLEELSAQSGVTLIAGDKDKAAGELLTVSLSDVPLGDALNALWSLVSYRGAAWDWNREGQAGKYTYRFVRPKSAQSLSGRLQSLIQQDFEAQAETLLRGAAMTEDERKQIGERDKIAGLLLGSERIREGLKVFGQVVPASEVPKVLRRQSQPKVQVSELSEAGKAWIHEQWVAGNWVQKFPDGHEELMPEPTSIHIHTDHSAGELTPTLFIELEGIGGYGYVGGVPMQNEWENYVFDLWFHPGDLKQSPLSEQTLMALPGMEATQVKKSRYPLAERLLRLSKTANVPIIACLPDDQRDFDSYDGKTLGDYLFGLQDHEWNHYRHKYRDGVLLLTYPAKVIQDEAGRGAWQVVKTLRQAIKADPDGLFAWDDLTYAAQELTSPQLAQLSHEFPVMEWVARFRNLMARFRSSRTLNKTVGDPAGVPLQDVLTALQADTNIDEALQKGAARLRITVKDAREPGNPIRRAVDFDLLSRDGKMVDYVGFFFVPIVGRE